MANVFKIIGVIKCNNTLSSIVLSLQTRDFIEVFENAWTFFQEQSGEYTKLDNFIMHDWFLYSSKINFCGTLVHIHTALQ